MILTECIRRERWRRHALEQLDEPFRKTKENKDVGARLAWAESENKEIRCASENNVYQLFQCVHCTMLLMMTNVNSTNLQGRGSPLSMHAALCQKYHGHCWQRIQPKWLDQNGYYYYYYDYYYYL